MNEKYLPIYQFSHSPIKLIVSFKYRFSVDSYQFTAKSLKLKTQNHNSKLKTFSLMLRIACYG